MPSPTRPLLLAGFALMLLGAGLEDPRPPAFSARLEVSLDPPMPARVYLFKNNQPFRLQPVQAAMPIQGDTFYRDRLWTAGSDPKVLEVIANDQYHYFMLKGRASFHLPPGRYRLEAYRGLFYAPASVEFELAPDQTRRLALPLKPWDGVRPEEWVSGDDHIHLTREKWHDPIYLDWLAAEDLSVGNFLQLQRQADAAPQYAFGRAGEARRAGYSIRPGQESRNQSFGHILVLGGDRLIRPLSTGRELANSPLDYPFHSLLFDLGRKAGATVGYAHFRQRPARSTLLMDLALGKLHFLELFQFGELATAPWYELLNAGFRIPGIAGSDFPVYLGRLRPWPRWLPLLGPERALVKVRSREDPYQTWAAGVREGRAILSNGPLVELSVDEAGGQAVATAAFYRPLETLEIVRNGQVVATARGDGSQTRLALTAAVRVEESCWVAARVSARRLEGEPEIQAHTNPAYLLRDGKPVMVRGAREALAAAWEAELARYRAAGLVFDTPAQQQEFLTLAERALEQLRRPPEPVTR